MNSVHPWLRAASPSSPPKNRIGASFSMSCGRSTTATTSHRVQIASSPQHHMPGLFLLEIALRRIPITPDLDEKLVVRHADLLTRPGGTSRQALFLEVMTEKADQRCSVLRLPQCGQVIFPWPCSAMVKILENVFLQALQKNS